MEGASMTRQTMVRAHARRLPEPEAYARVHLELIEARRFDMTMAEMAKQIAAELERDLREEQ
jgi:hypothetical protein